MIFKTNSFYLYEYALKALGKPINDFLAWIILF